MVVFNRDQLIVSVNPAFTAITGYQDHEILGYSADILLPDGAQDILSDISTELTEGGNWQRRGLVPAQERRSVHDQVVDQLGSQPPRAPQPFCGRVHRHHPAQSKPKSAWPAWPTSTC